MSDNEHTIVIGLGNPILGDDGVGVIVARGLQDLSQERPGIKFREACVGGLRLIEMMSGFRRAIIIDAYQGPLVGAGEVRRLSMRDLRGLGPVQPGASPHDASLPTAYDALKALGLELPDEELVAVYAVGANDVDVFSTELSPPVAAAVPAVRRMVLEELSEMPVSS